MTVATRKAAKKPAKTKASSSAGSAQERRKLFVEAYITNGGNATQAAISAGFSHHAAGAIGHKLLKHAEVSAQLQQRRTELARKYELTTDNVLRSLAQAVHFDPRKLYNPDGTLRAVHELDEDTAMALSGFEVAEEKGSGDDRGKVVSYTKKVKWLDKNTAREQAMKHLGLFLEDNKQKHPISDLNDEQLAKFIEAKAREAGVTVH